MHLPGRMETNLLIVPEEGITLRALDEMRAELYEKLKNELGSGGLEIYQPETSRSLDPAVVGAIGMVIAPVLLEKVLDILVKWRENKKACTITITIPIGEKTVEVQYNAQISETKLKSMIQNAIKVAEQQ